MLGFLRHLVAQKYFYPILSVLIAIPGFFFLLQPGLYWNMQDDMQPIRQIEMEKCLKDGQIPCRWSPDLGYGYGYPQFNFYPPFPYLVGQIFRTFGVSYLESVKLTAATQFIAMALSMYLLGSTLFGPISGLLSSIFYTYVPYHALNIYVRGAMNEAWASVFFPLILYFSYRLIQHQRWKYILPLALSYSGLFLCHNPMVLVFTPLFFVWCLFWLIFKKNNLKTFKNIFLKLFVSGLLSVCLVAFFLLPLLFEIKLVQVDTMFTGYFNYLAHFVSLRQLFISNFWGDGASVWQEEDKMSFMVGYLHWIVPALLILYSIFRLIKSKKIDRELLLPLFLTISGLIYIFFTHSRSTPLWLLLTPLQKIQFPWRLLNMVALCFCISVGVVPSLLRKYFKPSTANLLIIFLIFFTFVTNIKHFYPISYGQLNEKDKFSGQSWINQITSGIYDYLPKTADRAAQKAATEYVDKVEPPTSKYIISGQKHGTDWLFFNLSLDNQAKVTISQLYFPNFKIFDYDKELSFTIEPEFGRMVVDLSPGQHQLYIKLFNTPIRTVSNIISLITWLSVVIYLLLSIWKHSKLKN